jgi:HD-like signal output (HDOD) protein
MAARVLALCQEENYSTVELVRLLQADPGISYRILRLANSAYYGFRRQVRTLTEAVVLLGRVTVEAVALGASIFRAWGGRRIPTLAEDLWVHSYRCALGCRFLARRLPLSSNASPPETLFLIGLLHDLGKLFFLVEQPERYLEDLSNAPSGEALRLLERERFGCDHAEAAGVALERWDFPPGVSAVVRFHHEDGLRAELRLDGEILRAVDDLLRGSVSNQEGSIPAELLADLSEYLESSGVEARAVYRAVH